MLKLITLLIILSITGCDRIRDQKIALANSQAASISYIYDKKTDFCFAVSSANNKYEIISDVPCDKLNKNLIPNYPSQSHTKNSLNGCHFDTVLSKQNYTKI